MIKKIETICLITERKREDEETLNWCVSLARRQGASLIMGEILGELPNDSRALEADMLPLDIWATYIKERQRRLERLIANARQTGVQISGTLLTGKSRSEILKEVETMECDLLVLTVSSANDFGERQSDHLWERFARGCSCPVWARRMDARKPCERVLAVLGESTNLTESDPFGFDFKIMDTALSLARLEGATPHVLQVWRPPGEYAFRPYAGVTERQIGYLISQMKGVQAIRLSKTLDPYKNEINNCNVNLLKGKRVDLVCRVARESKIDLIVMGADSRFRVGSLFTGNTPRAILRKTGVSMALVSRRFFAISRRGKALASLQSTERLKSRVLHSDLME